MSPMPNYDQLLARLHNMKRRAIAFIWASHLGTLLALLSISFVLLTILAALVIPPATFRVILLAAVAVVAAGLVFWAIAKSTIWAPRPATLALRVERNHPELKNRLIAALQLAHRARSNPENYSLELVDLTIRQAGQICDNIDFYAALDRSPVRRSLRWAATGLVTALLFVLLFPSLSLRSWEAFSHPLADYSPPIPYTLSVDPGSTEAVKFDDFKIAAKVSGTDLPRTVTIHQRISGGEWRTIGPISAVAASRQDGDAKEREFHQVIPQIKHDFEYYVTAGELNSPVYSVVAVDRPRVTGLRLEMYYPRYTGLEAQVIDENDGTISAPVGSKVKVRIETNRRLASATIAYSDGDRLPLEIRPQAAIAEFTVEKNRSYHFVLLDESGRTNPHPIEYPITAIPDRDPSVEIVFPGHNADLDDNMAVDLKIVARDDYGFTGATLHTSWISEGRERAAREFEIPGGKARTERLELGYFWDLAQWGLMPEDVVHYFVEVTDNDEVTGPKTARSKTYAVRLPSLDEMLAEFENERESNIADLDKILKGEWEMARQVEDLRRELAQDQQIDWETQKNLEQVSSKGQQLEKELDQIAESMQQQLNQAQERRLQSVEMLQKMAEAQQLFNEVATDEMREAMRKLQEALQKLDPRDVQNALSEMQLSQEDLIKRLDRTIAYLKRLQAEQKVDAFVRQLEEMIKQQEALNKESANTDKEQLPNLAPSQEHLEENFEEFAADMAAADSFLTANKVASQEKVSGFCQSAQQCAAPKHMKDAANSMSQKDRSGAEKSGGESKQAMEQLLAEMKEFQEQMASKQREKLAKELREALDKVFYLSDKQEDLMARNEQLDANSLSLREMAAEQEALRSATEHLSEQISELGKQSSCISNSLGQCLSRSLDRMGSSAQSLSDRRGSAARNSQREAMYELNTAAQKIVDGMNKNCGNCQNSGMCDKPGKQGAMGKMQALSQRQGRLNQQMPSPSGNNGATMTNEERQALSRLRAEQQAIQKGVEDLHSDVGDQENMLGRLDKLAEEMKRVVEAMERSEVTEEVRNRQRRIYTRMLDFQHSLQRQDYKEQRKARYGEDILRASPDALDELRGLTDEEYERLLTRYQEEGYPKEYEETIREYFRALAEERGH